MQISKFVLQDESFLNCKESFAGESCDVCDDNYFFNEKGFYKNIKDCSDGYLICRQCIENYYLTKNNVCLRKKLFLWRPNKWIM